VIGLLGKSDLKVRGMLEKNSFSSVLKNKLNKGILENLKYLFTAFFP